LVVITGPIGAGKSTVARGLADGLRRAGHSAAVADLDDVFFMQRVADDDLDAAWARARRVHATLVAASLDEGIDVVVAHSSFLTDESRAPLRAAVAPNLPTTSVRLLVPFEVALERVTGDPERGLSKDPDFLRATHERFGARAATLPPADRTYDTTTMTADAIVDDLTRAVTAG
jgi:thymidylate kinase